MDRTVLITTSSLFVLVVLFHVVFFSTPARFRLNAATSSTLDNSPVLHLLEGARIKATARATNSTSNRELQLQQHCQLAEGHLQGVLAAVGHFQAAHGTSNTLPANEQARSAARTLRRQLHERWAAALAPFKTADSPGASCRSVGLVSQGATCPAAGASRRTTALMLVLGKWDSLDHMLRLYSINLFTIWSYARLHGYGLELYVHEEALPHAMPVYFIKVSGVQYLFRTLGYQHVLYLDFDTFTSPHSAPPLSLFFGEFPAASLLLQAEHNVCAAALLWRNTQDADMLLQAWWDVGAAGCCPTFPHDQTALKHMLLVYLANVTGKHWLYGREMQARFRLPLEPPPSAAAAGAPSRSQDSADAAVKAASTAATAPASTAAAAASTTTSPPEPEVLSTDHMPHKVSTWLQLRPVMQQRRSAVGWVGLDSHFPRSPGGAYSRVVLHNCLGMWWGCVPFDAPALLYHTGHWAMEDLTDTWLAERLLHSVVDWASTLDSLPGFETL